MGNALVRTAAWMAATVVAMAVSWFGVRAALPPALDGKGSVLTVSETTEVSRSPLQPTVVPTSAPSSPSGVPPTLPMTSTPAPTSSAADGSPTRTTSGTSTTPESPTSTSAPPPGEVRGYFVDGGHIVVEFFADHAELVSATPDPGWRMKTWHQEKWFRVDFSTLLETTTFICNWHDHPPTVEIDEHLL